MASGVLIEIVGRATSDGKALGDNPFAQSIQLYLKAKHLDFIVTPLPLSGPESNPPWLSSISPDGKLPLLRYGPSVVHDAENILDYVEKRHPTPSLTYTLPSGQDKGNAMYPALETLVVNKDPSKIGSLKVPLLKELAKLNTFAEDGRQERLMDICLANKNKKFLLDDKITQLDCLLAPVLYHVKVAGKQFGQLDLETTRFKALQQYLKTMESQDIFQQTKSSEEEVIKYWEFRRK